MSDPADIDLAALPPAIRAAFEAERAGRRALEADVAMLAEHNRRLEHLVAEFRQALYGKRSEKLSADERQLAFEDLEAALAAAEAAHVRSGATPSASRPSRIGVKRNQGRLPQELPRVERVIEPDSPLCTSGCGAMVRIGEDRAERLDIVPAQFRAIVTIRPRYACRRCAGAVTQAPAPAPSDRRRVAHRAANRPCAGRQIRRPPAAVSAGADPWPGRYRTRPLDRSTLADWVDKAAFHLAPIVDRMAAMLQRSGKFFLDETRAPVLDPGRGCTNTGYPWALARDDRRWSGADPPGVVYRYAPGRGVEHEVIVRVEPLRHLHSRHALGTSNRG